MAWPPGALQRDDAGHTGGGHHYIYNAAISTHEQGGVWVTALGLLSTIVLDTVEVSTIIWNGAIRACEKGGGGLRPWGSLAR